MMRKILYTGFKRSDLSRLNPFANFHEKQTKFVQTLPLSTTVRPILIMFGVLNKLSLSCLQ
jgi:hypothetical protein